MKEVTKMTMYEINYRNRLNEMVATIVEMYGENHRTTEFFTCLVNQRIDNANYANRECLENFFKKYVKKA